MGKRYYCNYCDKNMVATPTIVKTHNKGIVHQKLVQEHYQSFKAYVYYKDPKVDNSVYIFAHNITSQAPVFLQIKCKTLPDPETILAEEQKKKPCLRFAQGQCQFGGICRYSHYTPEQLNEMRDYVATKNKTKTEIQPSFQELYNKLLDEKNAPNEHNCDTILYDKNGITHVLPWTYNSNFDSIQDLPPSIKKLKVEDFINAEITEWG